MIKRLLLLLFFAATVRAQVPQLSITITDPDFESQTITGYVQTITDPVGCGTYEQGSIAGWALIRPKPGFSGGGVAHWTCNGVNSNVAFLNGGSSMTQLLTTKASQGVYALQFDVANWFYDYPGDWKAELYQGKLDATGNLVLSPAPFCSWSGWALGDMVRQIETCTMPGYFLQTTSPDPLSVGGQNPGGYIAIRFQSGGGNPALGGHSGWPILIDNVSLTFTPSN